MQIPAPTWCVAKPGAPPAALQGFLDYCCGRSDVNCRTINPGGACFLPNTLKDHTSWCLDLYYRTTKDCRPNIGMIVYRDPCMSPSLYTSLYIYIFLKVSGFLSQVLLAFQVSL